MTDLQRASGGEMEEKFTEGPMKISEDSKFSGSESYPYMVVLDYGVGPVAPNVMGCRMSKENALLFAAAPDLYEALKYLYDRCRQDPQISFILGDSNAISDAEAALTKALGKESL